MKSKLIGLAAIIIAVGASIFNAPKAAAKNNAKGNIMYYWFNITVNNLATTDPVPKADASFIQESSTPPSSDCPGGGHQCLSGFTSSQVSGDQLKDDLEVPPQTPDLQN